MFISIRLEGYEVQKSTTPFKVLNLRMFTFNYNFIGGPSVLLIILASTPAQTNSDVYLARSCKILAKDAYLARCKIQTPILQFYKILQDRRRKILQKKVHFERPMNLKIMFSYVIDTYLARISQ